VAKKPPIDDVGDRDLRISQPKREAAGVPVIADSRRHGLDGCAAAR
jgi:hypothetical protein